MLDHARSLLRVCQLVPALGRWDKIARAVALLANAVIAIASGMAIAIALLEIRSYRMSGLSSGLSFPVDVY